MKNRLLTSAERTLISYLDLWTMTKTTCLSNVDRNPHGYTVAFERKGYVFSKYFGDDSCECSLDRSIKYREWLRSKVGPKSLRGNPRHYTNTGIQGVRRLRTKYGIVYRACWSDAQGRKRQVSFSTLKYGEVGAFRRAIKVRREGLKERYGAKVAKARTEYPPRHERHLPVYYMMGLR